MNAAPLYAIISAIVNQLPMGLRLRRVLRDFVLGVVVSRSCLLDDVAHALTARGNKDSQYRRLQRFLANVHIDVAPLQGAWAQVVVASLHAPDRIVLLVDETALSDHLRIMVLGLWTPGGCIPIAWRSYPHTAYPAGGQAGVIVQLLDRVLMAFPIGGPLILLADRGIGTSPDLIQAVTARGLDLLFRVQSTVRFRYPDGRIVALGDLGVVGQAWQAAGDVFKKAGWLSLTATVAWAPAYDTPWCLVSSTPLNPALYAQRFDQEVSFRDLKSDGFQWHRSHVWLPDHADRLLLVLAICYWLILLVGQSLPPAPKGRAARLSLFRRGLDACTAFFRPSIAALLPAPLLPPHISCVAP